MQQQIPHNPRGLGGLLIRKYVKNSTDVNVSTVRSAYGNLASIVGIVCNMLLSGAKFLVGALFGSIAITADAVNNLSDASSSLITLIGFKMSSKPADEEHPYGHARFEYLAGLAVAVLIIVIGLELARTSVDKILHPTEVIFSLLSVTVLSVSIITKLWMMAFNKYVGKAIDSTTLIATSIDSRNDVITTAAVLVATIIAGVTHLTLDGWMGLGVAVFILCSGAGLVQSTLNPLLGEAPTQEFTQYIAKKVLSYEGVLGTHDLMIHDYGPERRFASVHVEMDASVDVMHSHDVIDNIERHFLEQDNIELVIHYDPIMVGDEAIGTKREWVKGLVQSLSPQLSIHDFRMVMGPTHTNLIFDVLVPPHFSLTPEALKTQICACVQAADPTCYAVIKVDTSYAPVHHDEEKE